MIEKVKEAKEKQSFKTPEEYHHLRRYDIVTKGGKERLIVPITEKDPSVKYFVYLEETFQIIHDTHESIGHGGRNRMEKELSSQYKNITREMIALYLDLCEICQKKHSVPRKGLVTRPIISKEMNSRCQVDLIDMQSQPDGEYKFIFVYQDHLTKFVQLRPLKSKRAEEVAYVLLDIFTIFGAPAILHSDNGREFCNKIIEELCSMWPELKLVHGKPRHSQSQGSVERANQDIENILSSWQQSHDNTQNWANGLRFVQFMKNRAHHSGIKCSPYEAMFGFKAKVGLKTLCPFDSILSCSTEEDLELFLSNEEGGNREDRTRDTSSSNPECSAPINEDRNNDGCVNAEDADDSAIILPNNTTENVEEPMVTSLSDAAEDVTSAVSSTANTATPFESPVMRSPSRATSDMDLNVGSMEAEDSQHTNLIENRIISVREKRKRALSNLENQANKMIKASNAKFPNGNIGVTVRVRVPDVDRARSDGRNILACIIEIKDNNLYKLGTKYGILNQLYTRNQFTLCKENFIKIDEVPNIEISLRE